MPAGSKTRPSTTYKLRVPELSEHAMYFTIVGSSPTPTALFLNSKELAQFEYTTALFTSYIRQLRQGANIQDIISDMKSTFSPNGAYIIPDGSGIKANSLIHHLGILLERHVNNF